MSLHEQARIKWIQLARTDNIGPRTCDQLLDQYGSIDKIIEAIPTLAKRGGAKSITLYSREKAEQEWENTLKMGATILTRQDAAFPKQLTHIKDCPILLTAKGNMDILNQESIGMVGARNASFNGCNLAKQLASDLGQAGFTIISGLAKGIDAASHQGALETGTIGVIAGGINTTYPRENHSLYHALYEQGCVITEYPLGSDPKAQHFPRRNRIISGISKGIIVIEATIGSGSLITAQYALEQGRDIFAVPGFPLDPRCMGPNKLIKQGAQLIESATDVIDACAYPLAISQTIAKPIKASNDSIKLTEGELDALRQKLENVLHADPIDIDQLKVLLECDNGSLQILLLELELAGRIRRYPNNKVGLIYAKVS